MECHLQFSSKWGLRLCPPYTQVATPLRGGHQQCPRKFLLTRFLPTIWLVRGHRIWFCVFLSAANQSTGHRILYPPRPHPFCVKSAGASEAWGAPQDGLLLGTRRTCCWWWNNPKNSSPSKFSAPTVQHDSFLNCWLLPSFSSFCIDRVSARHVGGRAGHLSHVVHTDPVKTSNQLCNSLWTDDEILQYFYLFIYFHYYYYYYLKDGGKFQLSFNLMYERTDWPYVNVADLRVRLVPPQLLPLLDWPEKCWSSLHFIAVLIPCKQQDLGQRFRSFPHLPVWLLCRTEWRIPLRGPWSRVSIGSTCHSAHKPRLTLASSLYSNRWNHKSHLKPGERNVV